MIPGFENYVEKLKQLAKKFEVKTVESTEFPPCIKHAIEVLENGLVGKITTDEVDPITGQPLTTNADHNAISIRHKVALSILDRTGLTAVKAVDVRTDSGMFTDSKKNIETLKQRAEALRNKRLGIVPEDEIIEAEVEENSV